MALMLTLRVSSQFHLILRMITRICLCETFFAFLVTSHMLLNQGVTTTKLLASD
ncbi:hypothetical protein T01_15140 [Trichinella spiralis]|uniref:Uncharacterized protein n=1 Tax=Trichinella spiralis TaxID=6334 RepID=A0A0V0YZR8_TRISP|nr:hypothetical protein T01_15140 [Trichinella spiralis]